MFLLPHYRKENTIWHTQGILSSKYVLWLSKENVLIKGGNAEISDFIANCDLFVLKWKNLGK